MVYKPLFSSRRLQICVYRSVAQLQLQIYVTQYICHSWMVWFGLVLEKICETTIGPSGRFKGGSEQQITVAVAWGYNPESCRMICQLGIASCHYSLDWMEYSGTEIFFSFSAFTMIQFGYLKCLRLKHTHKNLYHTTIQDGCSAIQANVVSNVATTGKLLFTVKWTAAANATLIFLASAYDMLC